MATSILIAKLIGPVLLVAAAAMVADARSLQEMAREFLASRALIFTSGMLTMLGGLAIVNSHNVWVAEWPVIITLIGWAMTIGGAVRMGSPSVVQSMGRAMMDKTALIRGFGAGWALIAAFLVYKGYF